MDPKVKVMLTACVVPLMVMASGGCRKHAPPTAAQAESPSLVTVVTVTTDTITQQLELTGEVRPWATVVLTPKVPGRLEKLGVRGDYGAWQPLGEGTRVRGGQILAQIDLSVYEARLQQAQAAADMASAQFADAQREEQRMLALFKDGSVTEQTRDKALTARRVAEAALAQTEAALKLARLDLAEATPRAPVDGVITHQHVDEGNIVAAGTPLVTIEQLARVKVLSDVPERYLPGIVPQQTSVRISSPLLPTGDRPAMVAKVHPAVDPRTRTGTMELHLDNADGTLRPGSFVHVVLEVARVDNAVVIPLGAVTWQGPEAYVFVADQGRARRRTVKVGIRSGERCQITEGLQPGEQLVVDGSANLRDGAAILTRAGGPQ